MGKKRVDRGHDCDKAVQPMFARITRTNEMARVVVVGIDGSETSWHAFWWTCGEVSRHSGRAIAVFVTPTPMVVSAVASAPFAPCEPVYVAVDQMLTERAEQLAEEAHSHAADACVDLTVLHVHGDTANELLRIAEANHANLIVVGKSMKGRHRGSGSLGRRLINRRGSPVIVVVP